MARAVARARPATAADLPDVLELFDELLAAGSTTTARAGALAGSVDPRTEAEARYRAALTDVDSRLLIAVVDDARGTDGGSERVVGMTLCTVGGSGTFIDAPVVHMHHFFVAAAARRSGAGRALLAMATAWAEARGLSGLGVTVYPGSREANRYFARLGFSPVYVHRVASLAGLKRVLGAAVPAAAREESVHGMRRRLRVGITGSRPAGRVRR